MAPPKPTKKPPREELAKAALAASKWAFGTKGLSEKQSAAALKNYRYVENRLRQTGGALTDTERGIGKQNVKARAGLVPAPVGSPDARDRGVAAQSRNLARGAAPTGGMGQTERARAIKAFTAPPKKRGAAVLKELERQGFSPPETEAQAQAQAKQVVRAIGGSEKAALTEALKQPLATKRNAKLIGEEEAQRLAGMAQARQKTARFLAREAAPPPPKPPPQNWGQKAAGGLDWLVPERVERGLETADRAAMGVAPGFLEAPMRNLKQVTADIAMAIPALGEVTYNDITGKTQWGLPKMLKEGLIEWGKGIERATPLPKDLGATIEHIKKGEFDQITEEGWQDLKDMRTEWTQKPFTAALNVYPVASGAARISEFGPLARNIARANPNMSRAAVLRAARKESYVPGYGAARGKWKGGIPKRILEGRIVHPETGEAMGALKAAARPPSRSALGRKIQGRYDRWSSSTGPLAPGRIPGTARFTEIRRAATSLNRKRTLEEERLRVGMLRQMEPVESYIRQSGLANSVKNTLLGRLAENRSRLAETFYGPQGPSGIDVNETLRAVATDLKQIAEEGGQAIPTDALGKLNKELRRVDLRLESLGPTVKFGSGLWAEAANVMRDAGYSQPQIEMNLELAAGAARAWAKREPGRDPNEWLGSPEGRNITGFEFGTPPAEALSQSLFQVLYPEDVDIPEDPNNPYRINRAALAANPALRLEDVPEALPFRTDIEWGTGGEEGGKMVMTHSRRHAEAQELLNEVWDFESNSPKEGADPKKVAEVEKLLPDEGRTVTDRDGNEVWIGRTSLQQKDARMSRFFETLDPDQQELFRRWYERTWDYISYLYGPEKMKAMGNAFYASQAAQSPAGGISMLFRVAEDIAAGKPMPTGKAQWLQRNVWKLMTSEDLGTNPSGLAAKLMDFFASGAGLNMRAIFGAMREIGPGVVDRWTWRSDGYITKTEKGEMMAARVPGVRASPGLGSAQGKAVAYEYSSIRLQKLTDLWNAEKRFGRDDWRVDQIQAVDWFATKKEWVDNEWTPSSAEGGSPLDMAIHNTREVSFRGDPETLRRVVEGAGAGVSLFKGKSEPPVPEGHVRLYRGEGKTVSLKKLPGGAKSTKGRYFTDNRKDAEAYASGAEEGKLFYVDVPEADLPPRMQTGEYLLSRDVASRYRPHKIYTSEAEGWTHAIVAGAAKSLDRLEVALGREGNAYFTKYPGQFGGTATKRSHQIDIPRGRREEVADAVRRAGYKPSDLPRILEWGEDSYRIDFGSGKRARERADAVAEELGLTVESRMLSKRGRGVRPTVLKPSVLYQRVSGDRPPPEPPDEGVPKGPVLPYHQDEALMARFDSAPRIRARAADVPRHVRSLLVPVRNQYGDADVIHMEFPKGWRRGDDLTASSPAGYGQLRLRPDDEVFYVEPQRMVPLAQRAEAGDIRGAVQFLDTESGRQLVYLSEHANASTFAHELIGHAAHEMKRELPAEFAAVEKRYKKPLEDWTEAEHERFATDAERYLQTGKAPIPELQPVFDAMRRWMYAVYQTITALGRPIKPETKALLDRYFGKEPIDFTPPQRTPKRLKGLAPGNLTGISALIDETADLLARGPDVLRQDPARRSRIAGHMKWLEQQVLPFADQMDTAVAARLHDLFDSYDEARSGSSIFSPDERRLLEARGKMLNLRHAQLNKMGDELRAQPDAAVLQEARDVMDDLDNAETLEDIQEAIKDLKVVSKEVGKRTRFDHESQRQLSRQVRDLERALDPNRKGSKDERDEALGVLREISAQMTDIYVDVFGEGLSPEALEMLKRSLAVRDNVLTTRLREMNLLKEGTGEGVYMPHYTIFDKLFSSIRGPVRLPAAGRTRKQLSMNVRAGRETFGKGANKLVRYGTGTVQADPRALFSAYKNRIRFLQTSMLRKQLYGIAVEIPKRPDGNPRIPEGWYIINATGHAVPARLARLQDMSTKEIDELLASGEDFDSQLATESGTVKMLEEYRDSWLSKEEGGKPPQGWESDKLRMLPPEVVETMVGKVFESTPGGAPQAIGGLLSVAGRVATIFQHALGYVQANVAANALLLGLTQPTRAPRAVMEFFKTPMSLRRNHSALYEDITVETGDIKAEAGLPNFYVKEQSNLERAERSAVAGTRMAAGFLGGISDQPFRVASWTGHARKYGYTDPEGWRELLDSTDPEVVLVRQYVSQRAREDMLDFNKLSPQEQRMARYLFIWPFVRAATAQPFWLMREYPGRVAALATASRAQEEAYEDMGLESVRSRYNKVAPAEERTMFDIGQVPVAGGTVNLNPINPVGPFAEKVSEVQRLGQGDLTALGDILNPAFSTAGEAIFGNRGFDPKAFAEVTVPGYVYWRALTDPKERGAQIYNDRDSFWDYIRRREGRFFPEDVSAEKIREKGKEEAEKLDKRPAWEKNQEEDLENVEKVTKAIKKRGGNITPKQLAPIQKSINAYNALDQAEDALADKLGKPADDLTEAEKVQATEAVVKEYWPEANLMDPDELMKLPDTARGKKPSKKGYRYALRDAIQAERSKFMSLGRDLGAVK